jgi:Icc-related predicted phosphoesterase
MLIVSDVHAEFDGLASVAGMGKPLLVLGDLLNFIDYRTGEGMALEVYGREFVNAMIDNRARGDWQASRRLWAGVPEDRRQDLRARIRAAAIRQYEQTTEALRGATAYVTFGNVDWPEALRDCLPEGSVFVDGDVVEIEGRRVGFVGGGSPTPVNARGEVSHEDMAAKLDALGKVDILCSHLPPAIEPLHRDVVTGRLERCSRPILDYILAHEPDWHFFGDVHQPQAQRWTVGRTRCVNVGYFRATRRAYEHP